ncbi:hypothetical protein BX600DRAFT_512327 [Xylariales sp. PMI_506]|nr:hypothetical protein BX600DRAFT_512327 [Xylariales sp. PMI_506]
MSHVEDEDITLGPQAPKYSRYRSQRGKSASTAPAPISTGFISVESVDHYAPQTPAKEGLPTATAESTTERTIARSMSRYRRRAKSISTEQNNVATNIQDSQAYGSSSTPPVPPVPFAISASTRQESVQEEYISPVAAMQGSPISPLRYHQVRYDDRVAIETGYRMAEQAQSSASSDVSPRRRLDDHDDQERRVMEEADALQRMEEVARVERETDRILAEQKRHDLERLQTQLSNSQPANNRFYKPKSPVMEKFAKLTKRRKSKENLSSASSNAGSISGSAEFDYGSPDLPEVPKLPKGIEAGGKGIVPQKDAPFSAVNHGDRIVSIRCKHHTFILPVTPETTASDIAIAAAKNMSYDLEWEPSESVVSESYAPLGLQRRLRKYESIRDVMNSWDRDTQNILIVSESEDPERDSCLDISSVPKTEEPPKGCNLYMYHSNRPGKWSKRWITLLDNGQMILSKKQGASASDKDASNLCHLSDYDIYAPVEAQMRRHLKPPKRHCFAVKSQNKPAMFMDTENFVQYFCTEDAAVATEFSEKVKAWRSWYLAARVPVKREIDIPKVDSKPPQLTSTVSHTPKKSVNVASVNGHRLKISVDESPYTIGEFEPLIDMKRFDKRLSQFGQDFLPSGEIPELPKPLPQHQRHVSKPSKSQGALVDAIKSPNDDAFTGNGLLGDGYDNRKAALVKETPKPMLDTGSAVFTNGLSLLNQRTESNRNAAVEMTDTSWFPSALAHSAHQRETTETERRPSTSSGEVYPRKAPRARSRSRSRAPPLPQQGRIRVERSVEPHPNPLGLHYAQPSTTAASQYHPNYQHPSSARRQPPKPLVNLDPTFKEPPQWVKRGHGVQAPDGTKHLVDFISPAPGVNGLNGGLLEAPPRSMIRRPNQSPYSGGGSSGGLSRTRSKSQSGPPVRSPRVDVPPVPTLPGRLPGGGERTATMKSQRPPTSREYVERGRDREKDRAYKEYNSVPGRTGTLKVV